MELLSKKQIRMLELLDKMVQSCTKCQLYKNGRAKPYWTPMSIYLAIGEAPGKDEVDMNEPFVGKSGTLLIDSMLELGLRKEQFVIINTVNCRPVNGMKNGKPTTDQIEFCKDWMRKYIKIINPEKAIALGEFAIRASRNGQFYRGVLSVNGSVDYLNQVYRNNSEQIKVVYSVHPAYCIYSQKDGIKLLKKSLVRFQRL
jgi:uracil-DNA glycosylase family 4